MNKFLSLLTFLAFSFFGSFSVFAAIEQVRVNGDNNDAEERVRDGNMYRDSSDLELGYDPYRGGTQIVGMRFQNVNVPPGARINSAYIEFETDETDSRRTNLVIHGQDIDDAPEFGRGRRNISGRTTTSASVSWSPGAWNSVDQKRSTPDIANIIQEIVNRSGWSDGNDMVMMIEPGSGCSNSNCQRTAEAYDGEPSAAPLLVIDYTASSASSYSVSSVHGACGTDSLLLVQFDSAIDSNALDINFYSLSSGSITGVTQQSDRVVVLTVSDILPGQSYTLTAGGVGMSVDFSGLTGHYFDQRSGGRKLSYNSGGLFAGTEYIRKDAQIGFSWGSGRPSIFPNVSGNNDRYSVRWNGYIVPAQAGDYEFRLYSDDGVRLNLSGTEIINDWSLHGPRYSSNSQTQALSAGVGYPIQMEFFEHTGGAVASMQWRRNGGSWEVVPSGVLSSCASSGTLSGRMNVDNQFQAYLSTDDGVQGTLIGSGNSWTTTEAISTGLIGGQDYYLHIYAQDTGGPAGFLGEFSLTGTQYTFENGSTTLLTNPNDWRVSTSAWSNYQSASSYGTNGVGPWGRRSGVNASAQWIWSADNNAHNVNYFTTKISISSSYSVVSVNGACGADNLLIVSYDNNIDSDALDPGYYSLSGGTVDSVSQQDNRTVVLSVSGMTAGNSYTLSVDGVDHAVDFGGLIGHYFDQRNAGGSKVAPLAGLFTGTERLRVDSQINFSWNSATPSIFPSVSGNGDRFSVRWNGYVVPSQDGDYEFRMYSDDGMRVELDSTQILSDWSNHGPRYSGASATQTLSADVGVPLKVEYFENGGRAYSWLQWRRNGGGWQNVPAANLSACAVSSEIIPAIEYRMDEEQWIGTTDEVFDTSGNGSHAVAQNDLSTDTDAHLCRAGSFDGVDDYISNADLGTTLSGTSSLSFWIKTTQTGNNTGWQAPGISGVEQSGGADDIFWGWLDASGHIGLSVGNDYSSKSNVPVNDGNYHHVVLTRDANTGAYKIYIDGRLNRSGFIAAGIIGTNFSSIGRIEDTGGSPVYFQGALDELKVFDQVLTDAQVTTIYSESRACGNLILDLRMEEAAWNGTAGEVIDSSGSGYHGRAVNGAVTNSLSSAVAGDPGTCRYGEFDDAGGASGDYIELTSFPNLTSSFTMTSWIRTSDRRQAGQRILADDERNTRGYAISLGDPGAGRIRFYSRGVSPVSLDTPSIIANNTWYFVAAVADISNRQRTIYIFDQSGTLLNTSQGSYTGNWGVDAGTATVGGESNSGETANRFRGNLDEVRVYSGALDQASISSILNRTHPCSVNCTLDSFTLTSPANAIACPTTRAQVDIQANCASGGVFEGIVDLSTNDSTAGLSEFYLNASGGSPVTSVSFDAADAGTKSIYLFYKNEKSDLTVTVDDQASAVAATTSVIPFSSQGFLVNRLDSNTSLNIECGITGSSGKRYSLTAYGQVQDGSGACAITTGFTGSKDFKSWFQVNYDPEESPPSYDTANSPLLLSGVNVSSGGSVSDTSEPASNNLNLTFASGVAEMNIDYADAGQIASVEFRHTHGDSGDVLSGSVPGFVAYPAEIEITAPDATECLTNFHNCDVLTVAGDDFRMQARAVCSDSSTAQSYETPSTGPTTTVNLASSYAPTVLGDYEDGALTVTSLSFNDVDDGLVTINNQRMSEVGVFRVRATAPEYFGVTITPSTSEPIGRFTPSSFEVSIDSMNIDFAPQCTSAADFTYMNQSFTWNNIPNVTIRALNAEGGVTANYEGDFWKLGSSLSLDSDGSCAGVSGSTRGFCYDNNVALAGITLQSPNSPIIYGDTGDVNGQVTLSMSHAGVANFIYDRTPGLNVVPFLADIDLDVRVRDAEGIEGVGSLNGVGFNGGAELRQGRWKMENAYGPETQELRMKAYPEYFNAASRFVRNADDLCSVASAMTDPAPSGGSIAVGSSSGSTTLTIASPLSDTQGENFVFSAPGATNTGNVEVGVSLTSLPWLRFDWDDDGSLEDHPDVTAQFGQFRGHDRIIYWREVSN